MKKIIFFMLIIVMIFANVSLASVDVINKVLHYPGITININDNIINPKDANGELVEPFTIDGTTYLPVRAVAEALGKEVSWEGETCSVYINDSTKQNQIESSSQKTDKKAYEEKKELHYKDISIYINKKLIEPKDVNGKIVEPFIMEGTTYLPVRAIAEAFNKEVNWDGDTKTVLISEKKISEEDEIIVRINNVVIKIIDGILCAEISSDLAINNFNCYSLTEGNIKAEPHLNIRSSANSSSEILGKIPNGSTVNVKDIIKSGSKDSWYKTTYGGVTGWISADYVDIMSSRLIIDLEQTKFDINTESKSINYEIIDSVRFGDQGNNINRIVLDLNKTTKYKVLQNETKTITYLALDENFKIPTSNSKDVVLVASNADKIYIPEADKNTENDTEDISGDKNENVAAKEIANVNSIKYSSSTNKTKISIDGKYEYVAFSLVNPDRVVVDITAAKLNVDGPKEIKPNDKNITAIRFSQNAEDVVRVVFDVNAKADYKITEKEGLLTIELKETTYKNIDYINYETYATLVLKNTNIKYFEIEKANTGNKYYITYSTKNFKSGTGTLEIDDDFVSEIVIKSSKITIYGNSNMSYSAKQQGDDVIITIKEKNDDVKDRVILIDPGHGGNDPGACNGSIYEKVYNLKIALKLYDMLKETDGIEVRMSRTEDVYMDRTGRLEFILDNDDADLLVSIHNNSLANKNYQGSMVLFYNKPGEKEEYGITSKEFATIVKENLITELETVDRGVISRDDLWVLTQNNLNEKPEWTISNIPSILCEVIFISNDEEAARLQTEEFQQKTATAIYDGIIEAISIMDNK